MAALRFLRLSTKIHNCSSSFGNPLNVNSAATRTVCLAATGNRPRHRSAQFEQIRYAHTVFGGLSGHELWSSVYGVSSVGRKRGRGKNLKRVNQMNLNFGKTLGDGKMAMKFPGLNAPLSVGPPKRPSTPQTIKEDSEEKPIKKVPKVIKTKKVVSPLSRGWTGTSIMGAKLGPPAPVGDCTFEGFQSFCIESKMVSHMTGTLGAKRGFKAIVVTGNQDGLVGMGSASSLNAFTAQKLAHKRAAQRLVAVPRFEDHTVYHNMFSQLLRSRVFIYKAAKGTGIVAHRVIKCICECVGIKDIYVKVEGSTSNNNVVAKAFLAAIASQETHQELANRTKLHVVECRPERYNQPVVVASPEGGIATGQPLESEEDLMCDFERYYFRGKLRYVKERTEEEKKIVFNQRNKAYKKKHRDSQKLRNQTQSAVLRLANLW